MYKGLFVLGADAYHRVYAQLYEEFAQLAEIYAPPLTSEEATQNPSVLQGMELLFTGWGGPRLDEQFLTAAPNLKAVFYGAGSIKSIATDAFWDKDIPITTATAANAIVVAEFTLAQILLCLKGAWQYALETKRLGGYAPLRDFPGAYGSVVGIVSLGMVGRRVCELLSAFEVKILAYDPYATPELTKTLNLELCSLEEIFTRADVVSLHTPWLLQTEGMITGALLRSMRPNATLINTARGAVIREDEMIAVLKERPDLFAVLDVTHPEPPAAGSPLYALPNVVLTPHIAGAMSVQECRRMGELTLDELKRFLNDEALQGRVTRDQMSVIA
jgi:phosphoglycerate dehydrogenase-like enzyme